MAERSVREVYIITDRDPDIAQSGNELSSAVPRDGNEVECITLSDTDSQTSSEIDDRLAGNSPGEVLQCTRTDANVEDEITNEEGCSLDNRDITVDSLPAMPDSDEVASNTTETPPVQCNEVPSDSTCTDLTMHPAVSSGDFDQVVHLKTERDLIDSEKLFLLNHHFVPGIGYQFPAHTFGKQSRHFQSNWLTKYNGLVYSQAADGGYCKYCVLFAQCEASVQAFGTLVNRPLTNFKKASDILKDHFGCRGRKSHQIAVEKAKAFCNVMTNQARSIDQQLSSQRAQIAAINREKLRSIAATIIFCGKQAISLRGHRDDWPALLDSEVDTHNAGNFHALLQFCVDAGDKVLKEHLETA